MKRLSTRFFWLAAVSAVLFAATHSAWAAKGGRTTPVTVVFDDLVGDAVQSDGLAYDGALGRDGSVAVETGARTLYFDFSVATTYWSFKPFGESAVIDEITMTVSSVDQATATVVFAFKALDPWVGVRMTDWELRTTVTVTESNGVYVLESASDAELWWLDRKNYTHGRGTDHRYDPEWVIAGVFDMPWGAEVSR